jgi:PAS domain S-box-containing protein
MDDRASRTIPLSTRIKSLSSLLPSGGELPEEVWSARHGFLVWLTWFHALLIVLIGPIFGYSWELSIGAIFRDDTALHTIGEGLIVALFALLGGWQVGGRKIRATLVGFGLMSSSAIFVHFSGGYIELHFHFFVMLVFIALYQDWVPYLLSVVFVALHHGVVGVLWPEGVYNHPAALNAPWTWAGIHAFFVLWSCVGSAIAWRFNEIAFARTKLILDCAGEGIFGLDPEGKITFINPAAEKMLRLGPGASIGKPLERILRHNSADGAAFTVEAEPILAPLRDRISRNGSDEIFKRNDGTDFPVDYTSTAMIERDELTGVVITFREVTERHRREQALQHSEAKFRALAETANDAIVSADSQGNIIHFNNAAERAFGYQESEVVGRPMTSLLSERFQDAHQQGLTRFLASGERHIDKTVELTGMRKTGSEFAIEMSLASWKTNGQTFFTSIIRDITERKQAQDALAEKAEELSFSNKELEQFAYVASHDLQEPLRMVASYTQLLAKRYKGKLDKDADEYIHFAVDGAKRMQGLIQDLLAYSRVGTKGKDFTPTDCEAVLARTLKSLELAAQEAVATITHDSLPTVMADETQLGQLFQNLIGNAIKYRNGNAPRVHVACKAENGHWQFSVHDNGIGIDPQYAERVFVIFQRLHTRDEYEGTGIGLAVCKKIIERHGGKIWLESEPGQGSTFYFTLPRHSASADAKRAAGAAAVN